MEKVCGLNVFFLLVCSLSSVLPPVSSPVCVLAVNLAPRGEKAAASDYDECVAAPRVIYLSGVIADDAVMSFPSTLRVSERTAALCVQIYGRLTLCCFYFSKPEDL